MKYIQSFIVILLISTSMPLVTAGKNTDADLYLPSNGTTQQLLRVKDTFILRTVGEDSVSFSHLGKIGYSHKTDVVNYYTSSNIFIAKDDGLSRSWPIGFTLRETKDSSILIEGVTSKLNLKDSKCSTKTLKVNLPFNCEFTSLGVDSIKLKQTIFFDSETLIVKNAKNAKQYKVSIVESTGIIGNSDDEAVSLWIKGDTIFISTGKRYDYKLKRSATEEEAPKALTNPDDILAVDYKEGLGVKSLYCDEDVLKTLAPNIEEISFIERAGRTSYYTIFLKNGTNADYETLEKNAYNLCILAITPPNKKSDSITNNNESTIQNRTQPITSSLEAKYEFPCKVDAEFLGNNKILAEIKHATAQKFIKTYLQENSLQKLYSSLNCVGDAITLNPEKAKYWVTLGKVHSEMSAHKLLQANTYAIQAYQQALELDATDTATMLLLAVKLTETSQYKEALQYFETALIKTSYLTTYNTIQWMNIAYLAGSQTKRGTLFYEQMVKENSELYYLYIFKAVLHQAHFDFAQAQKDFLKIINNENVKQDTKNIVQKLLQAMNSERA